jgi:hypothetical protein
MIDARHHAHLANARPSRFQILIVRIRFTHSATMGLKYQGHSAPNWSKLLTLRRTIRDNSYKCEM